MFQSSWPSKTSLSINFCYIFTNYVNERKLDFFEWIMDLFSTFPNPWECTENLNHFKDKLHHTDHYFCLLFVCALNGARRYIHNGMRDLDKKITFLGESSFRVKRFASILSLYVWKCFSNQFYPSTLVAAY